MKVALLVLFAIAGALGATTKDLSWRIIGGQPAKEGQFPYQISLRNNGRHSCGGSILDKRTILCAAHCVQYGNPATFTVVAGSNSVSNGGDIYQVESIKWHESFGSSALNNDVSIIKLSSDIQFSDKVQPVALRQTEIEGGQDCTLSGWGTAILGEGTPDALQWIDLKTTTFEECSAAHSYPQVYESEVCTLTKGNEGACHGDSGGPLVDGNGEQIGIVSWGSPCTLGYGLPDVFTRVSSFLDWIEKNR